MTAWLRRAFTVMLWVLMCLVCTSSMVHAFPYRGSVAGVAIRAQGTLFSRPGLSADTTFGSWEFTDVDGLPMGVHITPEDVDVLALHANGTWSTMSIHELRDAFRKKVPVIGAWLVGDLVIGLVIGIVLSIALGMAWRYLRGFDPHDNELRLRIGQVSAAVAVLSLIALYGTLTFNEQWSRRSRLTGTLGAVQLFPTQLEKFYDRQSKVYDVLNAVVGIQSRLQRQIDQSRTPDTELNIMFISDVHLAAVYPLIAEYAKEFDVDLVVNTGDESEFGTTAEMTPTFVKSIASLAAHTPMLWLAGNHDSPDTLRIMSGIRGVTVLGTKSRQPDGSFVVTASKVDAFGLTVAGLPDPRVYGAAGAFGAATDSATDPLEKTAVAQAVSAAGTDARFDVFATHEPVAADELSHDLGERIAQVDAGHVHAQNSARDVTSHGRTLRLIEGSTGAGGLDQIDRASGPTPIEFSIESVSSTCQFTKLQRFQVADPNAATDPATASQQGEVTVSTIYLEPRDVPATRVCSRTGGVGPVLGLAVPSAADVR